VAQDSRNQVIANTIPRIATIMQTHIIGTPPATGSQAPARPDTVVAALFAALLGMFVIWMVGFSHIDVAHNAAHDTRHSIGFPCH
jgi:cobalt transporter subunit CbtB